MSKKTLTVTGTGDALFVAPFPEYYSQEKKKVTDFINAHQVKITNLETNLSDFGSFAMPLTIQRSRKIRSRSLTPRHFRRFHRRAARRFFLPNF